MSKSAISKSEATTLLSVQAMLKDRMLGTSGGYANPNKILRQFKQEVLYDLLEDSHIYSCVQSRKSPVIAMDYDINEGDNKYINEFIIDIFNSIEVSRIITEMLEAPLFGYKILEIYYTLTKGNLIPVDVKGKPFEWFRFTRNGQVRFVSNTQEKELNSNKYIVLSNNGGYGDDYGESILTKCYWNWFFKKVAMRMWSQATEKYGSPIIVSKVPANWTEDQMTELNNTLQDVARESSLVISSDIEIDSIPVTLDSKTFENFIHFNNAEISKAILSQTLTTEQGDSGSYAMSQTHLQVRDDVVRADKTLVEQGFNQLIDKIVRVNFDKSTYRKLPVFELIDKNIDSSRVERDIKLKELGVKFRKDYIHKYHKLDIDDFDIVEEAPEENKSLFVEAPETSHFDKFTESVMKMAEPLMRELQEAGSYEKAEELLLNKYPELDEKAIDELLMQLLMVADMKGREEA